MNKKRMYIVIVLVFVISLVKTNKVYAASDPDAQDIVSGDWQYWVKEDEAYIDNYLGKDTSITIPSVLDGFTVTKIDYYCFSRCDVAKSIQSVTIPASVKEICPDAFAECINLKQVNLNEGLEVIGGAAFYKCEAIEKIVLPDGLKKIGWCAFSRCISLDEIIFPDSLESIEDQAFSNCKNLADINIPAKVSSIGINPFEYCTGIEKMNVNSENIYYNSRNDCNAIIETKANAVISACSTTIIPDDALQIYENAFAGVHANALHIPSGIKTIRNFALIGSDFETVDVDSGNTTYDSRDDCNAIISKNRKLEYFDDAFSDVLIYGCSTTVVPDTVSAIGDRAFEGSAVKTIRIPSSVKVLGVGAFAGSDLEEIVMDEGVEELVLNTFQNCSKLTKINFPKSLVKVDESAAFSKCTALETIEVADGNPVFDSRDNCNALIRTDDNILTIGGNKTVIPESVTEIYYEAFKGRTGLKTINIPKGLQHIQTSAFEGCTGLQEVLFPEGWHFIYERAFKDCTGLKSVKIMGRVSIRAGAFNNCNNLKEIWIPSSVKEDSIEDEQTNYEGGMYPPFAGCAKLTIVTPKDSYAQQYAVEHNIPYRNEDIWSAGDVIDKKTDNISNNDDNKEIKDETEKTDASDNKKEDASVGQNQHQEQTSITEQQDTNTSIVELSTDNVTTFNIKNKKTYKKSKKVIVKDKDGIKSIKINGKTIKVKSRKKSISFKLSKYKKYFKKKGKWNKLVVTDVNGNKKTIQFKVK